MTAAAQLARRYDYLDRCWALVKRGVHPDVAEALRGAADASLLGQVETMGHSDIVALNRAWLARAAEED